MRCKACDVRLTDFESCRKYEGTDRYVDLCNKCFQEIAAYTKVEERPDLENQIMYIDSEEYDDESIGSS